MEKSADDKQRPVRIDQHCRVICFELACEVLVAKPLLVRMRCLNKVDMTGSGEGFLSEN